MSEREGVHISLCAVVVIIMIFMLMRGALNIWLITKDVIRWGEIARSEYGV